MPEEKFENNLILAEKIFLLTFAAFLLIGATILHVRYTRPCRKITIVEGAVKQEYTLKELESRLKESRRVNINTATQKEFTTIPCIGPTLAGRIVEYRDIYGTFCDEKDLLKVQGIGEKKLEKFSEYVKVE